MTHTDLFEVAKLRSLWFDLHGLLKARDPDVKRAPRPRRKQLFTAHIAGLAVAFNVAAAVDETPAPSQVGLAWPTAHAPLTARQSLRDSLKHVRQLKAGWNGRDAPAPIERAISVAEYIVPQLPDVVADARAGVDGDGNVFLRLHTGDRVAYIVVEPKAMHLLFQEAGQPNVYIDEEQFNGKVLPARIKKVLDERLKT